MLCIEIKDCIMDVFFLVLGIMWVGVKFDYF